MAAAAPIAAVASLASVGLSAAGQITQAQGVAAGDEYKAEALTRAATVGEIKATQTSADLTRQLNETLGTIDVMRAAGHDDPLSPTGQAYRDFQETVGENQRSIAVNNILEQSRQDIADAAYLRSAGQTALLSGDIGAGATILKGIGGTSPSAFGLAAA